MKAEKDYYQALGIQRNASDKAIREAYFTYAAKFHPDKHDGDLFFEERFKEIKEAYEILSNQELRTHYDIKKFGRSKVIKSRPSGFEDDGNKEKSKHKWKFRIDVSHLEIYLTLFYLVNLVAWVVIKRIHDQRTTQGYIWSLFFCGVSTLLMWLFITKLFELRQRPAGSRFFLILSLFLSLLIGLIPLVTVWIP